MLTPAEAERLAILMEECAEVQQVIGKILRHGYESKHPEHLDGPTNRELLERELGDIEYMVVLMRQNKDVNTSNIIRAKHDKELRIGKYVHHQDDVRIHI